MSDWNEVTLGSICHGIYDGPHATPKRLDQGPIFLGISSLNAGRIDLSKSDHLSEADFKKWTRRITPQENDIVFSYETRLGEAALIPAGLRCCLGRRMALIRPDISKVNPQFLLYAYLSPKFQGILKSRQVHGSTVNRIPLSELPDYPVLIPSLETQNQIASTLSNLDRKIENLRRQNETLEAIAQTLFKHWFIDFEFPNADGKPYKSSGGAMERSELGEIPAGWRVGQLGDEFDILMGQSPAGSSYNEDGEGLIFFQGRTDFGFRFPQVRLFTTEPKRIANKFDVLVSVRAPVGDINVAFEKCCIGRGLSAVSSQYKSYCLYKLKSFKKFFDVFESEGTVFGSLNKQTFNELASIIPNSTATEAFESIVSPMDSKIFVNERQIQTLTQTRDVLLPKLMSGKLRIQS